MNQTIDAIMLGGTLFVPADHRHLEAVAAGEKFPELRSMVIDTEDGLSISALEPALERIAALLPTLERRGPLRFLRPRSSEVLRCMKAMPGIDRIDGFVLPKFDLENAREYLDLVGEYRFMPAIEGSELFDVTKLVQLKVILLPYVKQIIAIRFGGEDMLRQLGMRRECGTMLYDLCAPARVIADVLATFKPAGFDVAAPVYRCYDDAEGFEAEVRRDLAEGLVSKTIIHPSQIEPIERIYRVGERELGEAMALTECTEAVFASFGAMAEQTTHERWARGILRREGVYGRDTSE